MSDPYGDGERPGLFWKGICFSGMPRSAWSFRDSVKEHVGQERDPSKHN